MEIASSWLHLFCVKLEGNGIEIQIWQSYIYDK